MRMMRSSEHAMTFSRSRYITYHGGGGLCLPPAGVGDDGPPGGAGVPCGGWSQPPSCPGQQHNLVAGARMAIHDAPQQSH